jgi:hypothetical protein
MLADSLASPYYVASDRLKGLLSFGRQFVELRKRG